MQLNFHEKLAEMLKFLLKSYAGKMTNLIDNEPPMKWEQAMNTFSLSLFEFQRKSSRAFWLWKGWTSRNSETRLV